MQSARNPFRARFGGLTAQPVALQAGTLALLLRDRRQSPGVEP